MSRLAPGRIEIGGVAFAGEQPVTSVEVSTDGGESWQEARLVGADHGPTGWRRFRFAFEAAAGTYVLASRARDRAGNLQPRERPENERGYGNNGWFDHRLTVRVE